jgi:hypothetical protein
MAIDRDLLAFVNALPVGPAYAPIYAKGEVFGKNKDVSSGKAPHEQSHHRKFSPADVAYLLENEPKRFVAIGLFTGIRSQGIVILDVDKNLATLMRKRGDTLQGAPRIDSTKKNSAKFVFRVPKEQWSEVKGITLSQGKHGYEVLWGMQGVVAGVYPGSSDGKAPQGRYKLVQGDLGNIPEAPEWLLAEMRARKAQDMPSKGLVKNRRGLDFSGRTQDELAEIVHDCLQVLPHLGRGSEDQWWHVGAMVAEVLPTDLGLTLWSAWSAMDPAYEEDWSQGNPCEAKWRRLVEKAGRAGNAGLGSLIKLADEYDPERLRFQDTSRRTLEEVEQSQAQRIQYAPLDFQETIRRAKEILELENPAELNYRLHGLAIEAGYRDKDALERLLVDQIQYEAQTGAMSLQTLVSKDFKRDYIIPDLLPKPYVVLLYGAGGDGKSMTAWTLAKHISMGIPFVIRGKHVPVEQGPVLLLNGDQPMVQLQEQLQEVEIDSDAPVHIQGDWSLQRYAQFVKLMEQVRPRLVVIDSLIGCSGGRAFDENKSEFATPLYWLTRNNGILFPATTIVIVHHANKQGGFRGTSAIRDAVDEVWALKKPTDRELESTGRDARIVLIEKSRQGRSGTGLLLRLEADLTFTLADWKPEIEATETSPAGITDRVLNRLRVVHPDARTKADLEGDPQVGGSVKAIAKSLQRLVKRGLITVSDETQSKRGGSPKRYYRAVLSSSRGECVCVSRTGEDPSEAQGSYSATPPEKQEECRTGIYAKSGGASHKTQDETSEGLTSATPSQENEGCRTEKPLRRKGSGSSATRTASIRARVNENDLKERDLETLARLDAEAAAMWDLPQLEQIRAQLKTHETKAMKPGEKSDIYMEDIEAFNRSGGEEYAVFDVDAVEVLD